MRIWSIHPVYLDSKGLVACWRESLLALSVLQGKTNGYKNHPQLQRFKNNKFPVPQLQSYLRMIWEEGNKRGYYFNFEKIGLTDGCLYPTLTEQLTVTQGQLEYEFLHLQKKLMVRCPSKYLSNGVENLSKEVQIKPNPIFKVIDGQVESWEKIKQ